MKITYRVKYKTSFETYKGAKIKTRFDDTFFIDFLGNMSNINTGFLKEISKFEGQNQSCHIKMSNL
jgi:hypothetical protein